MLYQAILHKITYNIQINYSIITNFYNKKFNAALEILLAA